jgi:protocatechuate 3,4-dioxygenase alpha subunit
MIDGGGAPVGDAMVETWQAAAAGAAPDGKAHGIARVETAKDGTFRIETTKPQGSTPSLEVFIFARGLLKALHTRVYFASVEAVRADPSLQPIASSPRVATLVAREARPGEYHWDVRLQGEGETVFFEAA